MMENESEFTSFDDRLSYWQRQKADCEEAAIYYVYLGSLLTQTGSLADAQAAFRTGLEKRDGSERELKFGLSDVAFRMERLDEALAIGKQLELEYPTWAGSHAAVGQAQLAFGRYDEGINSLETANEIEPSSAVYQMLVLGYYAQDRPREAARAMQAALRLDRPAALTNTSAVCATVYSLLALGFVSAADDLLQGHAAAKPSAMGHPTFVQASAAVREALRQAP